MVMRQWAMVTGASMMCLLLQSYGMAQQIIPSETFSFQNGADGYNSSVDTTIYAATAFENQVGAGRLRVYKGTGSENANTLIRFDGLEGLAGVQIGQAFITLRFQLEFPQLWNQAIVDVFEMQRNWSDAATWFSAENGEPDPNWILPGVQDPNERGPLNASLDMGERFFLNLNNKQNYDDEQAFNFELDPALVKSWVDNPVSNLGVLLVLSSNSDVLFSSNEDETLDSSGLSMKPKLTVITSQICPGISTMDLTGDHFVNYEDFAMLASEWLTTYGLVELTTMAQDWLVALHPDINGDGFVDYFDFQILNSGWQVCYDIDQLMDLAAAWLTCTNGSTHPNCEPGE